MRYAGATNLQDLLKCYNKDIVTYKQTFFKNVCVNDLKDLLATLSYNLSYDSSNYRWGKRYFNRVSQSFTWVSDTNKLIRKFYWDKVNHCQADYFAKAYFTDKMIEDHFLSCYKSSRKINFYYKFPKVEQEYYADYIIALENLYKINNKTYGCSQQLGNVIIFDIDNRRDKIAIKELKKLLNYLHISVKDLMFIEQNVFSGGIHTALKLPLTVNDEQFYQKLMTHLNSLDINVECNFINNFIRLPLSFEYVAIQKLNEILDIDEFIPESLWEKDFESFVKNINQKPCYSKFLTKLIADYKKYETIDKWGNYWDHTVQRFTKTKGHYKAYKIYDIVCGHRYETISKVVPYLKICGYTLEETADEIIKHDTGSKDLARWGTTGLLENISKFYRNCTAPVLDKKFTSGNFVSNIDKLPTKTLDFLSSDDFKEKITKAFVNHYNNLRKKHDSSFKSLSKDKEMILSTLVPYYIQEIIGLMFYHIDNPKITDIDEEIGFQISDQYLSRLQDNAIKRFNLDSDNTLVKTSLQYLKKALIKSLSLKEINYKHRKRNWMNGSCKSYTINSLKDINDLLDHLYNSLFNNCLHILCESNISYILLGGNPCVSIESEKNFRKMKIPLDKLE